MLSKFSKSSKINIITLTPKPSQLPRNKSGFNKHLEGGTTFKEKATISILSVDAKAVVLSTHSTHIQQLGTECDQLFGDLR